LQKYIKLTIFTIAMEENCPIAQWLSVLSRKWALFILHELTEKQTMRFTDIQRSIPTITPRTLSLRLKELHAIGLIEKKIYSEIPPRVEYTVTHKGRELRTFFKQFDAWAKKSGFCKDQTAAIDQMTKEKISIE